MRAIIWKECQECMYQEKKEKVILARISKAGSGGKPHGKNDD